MSGTYIEIEAEPGSTERPGVIRTSKLPLRLAATMALLVFALAIGASQFGWFKDPAPAAEVVFARTFVFADRPDGGVDVQDQARGGAVVYTLPNTQNGFVRGALRALARSRRLAGIGPEAPFTLTRYADGRFTLHDPSTGESVEIGSFGPTQVQAFQDLLVAGVLPPSAAAPSPAPGADDAAPSR
jgi:putative photosynthetic complex assembly protein